MDDTPYEERRGGSYIRERDGTRRLVERTEEPQSTEAAAPADAIVPIVPPAAPPAGDPPADAIVPIVSPPPADDPPAESKKPEKRGK